MPFARIFPTAVICLTHVAGLDGIMGVAGESVEKRDWLVGAGRVATGRKQLREKH